MLKQFNFTPIRTDGQDALSTANLALWLNKQFQRLAESLTGPRVQTVGIVATSSTLSLALSHLTTVTLSGNAALTLDLKSTRAGAFAYLELTQDATGGHTPTWVNALASPAVATTATKRTLVLAVHNGSGWVLSTVASGY